MADSNGSPSTADAPPSNESYSMPMSINVADLDEDSDDYEYEYSTTETETFYVTLDLTTPNVPVKRKLNKTHPRRNAKQWLNPGLGKHRRFLGDSTMITGDGLLPTSKGKGKSAKKGAVDDEDDMLEENEDQDAQTPPLESVSQAASISQSTGDAKDQNGASADVKPEVQILGLHEDHPVISYEGHVYKCQWEENLGTELLFTAHDPDSKLPVLRHISNDIDLLAASAARITATKTKIKEKYPSEHYGITKTPYGHKSGNIRALKIPVGVAASNQRKSQAFFLQSLIQAKEAKNEKDLVTVMAQKRNRNSHWRQVMKQKRAAEQAQIRKDIKSGKISAEDGQKRLDEIAKEEEILQQEDRIRGFGPDGKRLKIPGRKRVADSGPQSVFRRPPGGMGLYLEKTRGADDTDGLGEGSAAATPQSNSVEGDEDEEMEDFGELDEDDDME
ncbi:transcription factor tau55-related protein [Rutstroemia sp. NJR-2017a WRK4]|nr:transcription factor tau55-related protein [Rutstroemia sp. NJR-2017a WRK4]